MSNSELKNVDLSESNHEILFSAMANNFWKKFKENENIIYKNLLIREDKNYNNAVKIISNIKLDLKITNDIGTYFSIDTRNGMKLKERKSYVEFILTPLFQKSNIPIMNALYDAHFKYNLPKYWNIVKYKFFQPELINSISLNYESKDLKGEISLHNDSNVIEITKDDFSYAPIYDDQKKNVSILLFVKDDKSTYVIKKETYNDRELWIPNDTGIHAILDSAIGEYNLLNKLDKMEIHLESDLKNDEFKDIEIFKIESIFKNFEMLNNHSLSSVNKCGRCSYTNNQVNILVCKCKKTFYCDIICQRAHFKLHKSICNSKQH
jgi:hypothetical protein